MKLTQTPVAHVSSEKWKSLFVKIMRDNSVSYIDVISSDKLNRRREAYPSFDAYPSFS